MRATTAHRATKLCRARRASCGSQILIDTELLAAITRVHSAREFRERSLFTHSIRHVLHRRRGLFRLPLFDGEILVILPASLRLDLPF